MPHNYHFASRIRSLTPKAAMPCQTSTWWWFQKSSTSHLASSLWCVRLLESGSRSRSRSRSLATISMNVHILRCAKLLGTQSYPFDFRKHSWRFLKEVLGPSFQFETLNIIDSFINFHLNSWYGCACVCACVCGLTFLSLAGTSVGNHDRCLRVSRSLPGR